MEVLIYTMIFIPIVVGCAILLFFLFFKLKGKKIRILILNNEVKPPKEESMKSLLYSFDNLFNERKTESNNLCSELNSIYYNLLTKVNVLSGFSAVGNLSRKEQEELVNNTYELLKLLDKITQLLEHNRFIEEHLANTSLSLLNSHLSAQDLKELQDYFSNYRSKTDDFREKLNQVIRQLK